MAKLITEFIGTGFLVLVILLTGNPIAIGAVLMAMVYMGYYISGAHFNPAITLGFAVRRRIAWGEAIRYWIVQFAGAMFAAGIAWCLHEKTAGISPPAGAATHQWYLAEIVFSFALVLVVFNTTDSPATKDNQYYGLAIGFTYLVGAFAGSPISGGAFNPAVGIGPNIVARMNNSDVPGGVWLLYLVAPSIGAILAVIAFTAQRQR